jgi:hypothetical protein
MRNSSVAGPLALCPAIDRGITFKSNVVLPDSWAAVNSNHLLSGDTDKSVAPVETAGLRVN